MRCEVVAVGTELLLGHIVNGNAAVVGEGLAGIGWDCLRHTAVGDNVDRIAASLREALGRADAVVMSGGLGPTQDDVTRDAIAAVAGVPLVRDHQVEAWLRARYARAGRGMPVGNLRQADVPAGGRTLDNPRGTAPGLLVEIDGRPVYALPGVPRELEVMLSASVLPDLAARAGGDRVIRARTVRTAGVGESTVAALLAPLWEQLEQAGGVQLAYLAGSGEVRVRLTAAAADETAVRGLLDPVEEQVRALLGSAVYGTGDESLPGVCGAALVARGWTLAAAESLTGGLVGARLTEVPGASAWYLGGVGAYAREVKEGLLAVPRVLLDAAGPVSEPVAEAMAENVRSLLGADVGVATTGVAGPGAHGGQPPGSVCVAVADPRGAVTRSERVPGDRDQVRRWTTMLALDLLRRRLRDLPTRP